MIEVILGGLFGLLVAETLPAKTANTVLVVVVGFVLLLLISGGIDSQLRWRANLRRVRENQRILEDARKRAEANGWWG